MRNILIRGTIAVALFLISAFPTRVECSTLKGFSGNGVITLKWTPNVDVGLEGYRVYYGEESGVYGGTASHQGASPITVEPTRLFSTSEPDFSITGLPKGVRQYFKLVAVVSGGETDQSNEVSVLPGGWPAHLSEPNPFQNPDFENGFNVWDCQWGAPFASYIDSNIRLFGAKSLNIVNTNTNAGTYRISSSQDVSTIANTDYIVSVWVRGGPVANAGSFIGICNIDGGWEKRFGIPIGTYPWTRVSYLYNTGPSNQFLFAFVSETSGTLWVDGIEMAKLSDVELGPPYPETLVRYENNPVLGLGAPGSLDDAHVYNPAVIREGKNDYKMYYAMHDGTNVRIGLAQSEDGIAWTKYAGNPVLNLVPGTFEETHVIVGSVLKVGSVYHMYYEAYLAPSYQIGHVTSTDGISWNRSGSDPALPVGNEGTFTSLHVLHPSVIYDDNTFKMWYAAYDSTVTKKYHIGYAVSDNGATFVKQGIVLSPGGLGEIDMAGVVRPYVEKNPDGTGYTMHYSGSGPTGYTICRAVSQDGTLWTPVESELAPSYDGSFDSKYAYMGSIVPEDNELRMYYSGYGADNVWRIGFAEQTYTPTPPPTETPTPEATDTPTETPRPTPFPADINEDGVVDENDAFILQQQWHWQQY